MVEKGEPSTVEPKTMINKNKAGEFLKLIKHNEYSIVELLNQQHSKILILSLLLNIEPYRDTFLKVLNQTYVIDDISTKNLNRLMGNITIKNFIFFSNDEILSDGRESMKAFHITTNYKGHILPEVLIDNGYALNVMPLSTFEKLPIDMSYMKRSHTTMRVFDGMRWDVSRNVELPLEIGPCTYDIEFQVMDITLL